MRHFPLPTLFITLALTGLTPLFAKANADEIRASIEVAAQDLHAQGHKLAVDEMQKRLRAKNLQFLFRFEKHESLGKKSKDTDLGQEQIERFSGRSEYLVCKEPVAKKISALEGRVNGLNGTDKRLEAFYAAVAIAANNSVEKIEQELDARLTDLEEKIKGAEDTHQIFIGSQRSAEATLRRLESVPVGDQSESHQVRLQEARIAAASARAVADEGAEYIASLKENARVAKERYVTSFSGEGPRKLYTAKFAETLRDSAENVPAELRNAYIRVAQEIFELEQDREALEADCAALHFDSYEKHTSLFGPKAFELTRSGHVLLEFPNVDVDGEDRRVTRIDFPRNWQLEPCRDSIQGRPEGMSPFHFLAGNLAKVSQECRDALGVERAQTTQDYVDPNQLKTMAPVSGK